ncbi:MAG: hypothetical protein WC841_04480 [Candidatus Shapirobacteria bacterium]|jgi:hypothetical protein
MRDREDPVKATFRLQRVVSIDTGRTVFMVIYRADKVGGGVGINNLVSLRKDLVGKQGVTSEIFVLPPEVQVRKQARKDGRWSGREKEIN